MELAKRERRKSREKGGVQSIVRTLCRQVEVELKMFFRNQHGAFLHFAFPVGAAFLLVYLHREGVLDTLFRFLFGFMNQGQMENVPVMSFLLPALIGYCVIAVAFEDLSPKLTRQRDNKILKRLGGTPLRGWVLLGGKVLSAGVIALLEILVTISIVTLFSDIMITGDPWWSLVVLITGIFIFASMGFAVAGLVKNTEAAVVAVHAIYIPMFFLCGALFPIEVMPELLQYVAKALPLTYFLNLLRGIMMEGNNIVVHVGDFLILLGWIVGSLIVSLKTFRWE
jgi:ABC-2 type transport system permease protein